LIPSVQDGHEQACPLFAGPKRVLWVTSEPPAGHVKDEVTGIGNGPPLQVSDDQPEATRALPCFGQTTTSGMSGVSQPKGQPQSTRSRKAGQHRSPQNMNLDDATGVLHDVTRDDDSGRAVLGVRELASPRAQGHRSPGRLRPLQPWLWRPRWLRNTERKLARAFLHGGRGSSPRTQEGCRSSCLCKLRA
jgi:hypothetical protein